MYSFSSAIISLGGVSSLFHSVHDNAFCIAIETNDYDLRAINAQIGIHEVFARACRLLTATIAIDEMPIAFATAIDSVLRESRRSEIKGESTEANFAAAAFTRDSIFVCTAGLCRVHLIQNGELLGVTRDHNFVSDLFAPDDIKRAVRPESDPVAFNVPTRTLGSDLYGNKPPEVLKWDVEGDYSVLICSSSIHRFREPREYLSPLLTSDLSRVSEAENCQEGFVAVIGKRFPNP